MRGRLIFVLIFFLVGSVSALDCSNETGIISYWQFEDDMSDGVGDNDDGSHIGYSSSKVGSGIDFGSSVSITEDTSLDFSSRFTIQFWLEESMPLPMTILGKSGEFTIDIDSSDMLSAIVGGVTVNATVSGEEFISLVWDQSSLTLYVDGIGVDSDPLSSVPGTSNDLILGETLIGQMDELAIWGRSLSPSEILADYQALSSGRDYCYISVPGSGESETQTEFEIPGCRYGEPEGSCSKGWQSDGFYPFYCKDREEQGVFESGSPPDGIAGACLWGGSYLPCCPMTYECRDDTGEFFCEPAEHDCDYWDNKDDCHEEGGVIHNCLWSDPRDECVDPDLFTCGDYLDEPSCEEDLYSVGFYDPFDTCSDQGVDSLGLVSIPDGCTWKQGNCVYGCSFRTSISFGDPFDLDCFREDNLTSCEDGIRILNSTVSYNVSGPTPGGLILSEVLSIKNCVDKTEEIVCGAALVRLPGFSFFNILSILVILIIFYFLFKKDIRKGL
jgi:hypothetical protein